MDLPICILEKLWNDVVGQHPLEGLLDDSLLPVSLFLKASLELTNSLLT
ncbi:MAG: hypothetical protein Q7V53_03200 [Caldisericota bacterium]|nr:hypothetical protein [Caldisericota bacterium]